MFHQSAEMKRKKKELLLAREYELFKNFGQNNLYSECIKITEYWSICGYGYAQDLRLTCSADKKKKKS